MSEDEINEEQRAATQTVAKALDDAIGENAPPEIRKSQDEDDASIDPIVDPAGEDMRLQYCMM